MKVGRLLIIVHWMGQCELGIASKTNLNLSFKVKAQAKQTDKELLSLLFAKNDEFVDVTLDSNIFWVSKSCPYNVVYFLGNTTS